MSQWWCKTELNTCRKLCNTTKVSLPVLFVIISLQHSTEHFFLHSGLCTPVQGLLLLTFAYYCHRKKNVESITVTSLNLVELPPLNRINGAKWFMLPIFSSGESYNITIKPSTIIQWKILHILHTGGHTLGRRLYSM